MRIDGWEVPFFEVAQCRVELQHIELKQINWQKGFVKLAVCGVTWFDHRPGIVKLWQRYVSAKQMNEAATKAQKHARFIFENELDPELQERVNNDYDRAGIFKWKAEDQLEEAERNLKKMYNESGSRALDWPIIDITVKGDRNGKPYLVVKASNLTWHDEYCGPIYDDDRPGPIGLYFMRYGCYGNFLYITPNSLELGGRGD